MENYLLCSELSSISVSVLNKLSPVSFVYKGRRKGTVQFVGIHRHDKEDKKYIENGVQIMHTMDHNNVLQFIEWYETPQHIWVITDLAVGGSLADLLKQDGFLPDACLDDFVRDISAGLNYIHSRGVLYCDLQPAKIVLDSCQLLKLCDFTLARRIDDSFHEYNFRAIVQTLLSNKSHPLPYSPSPYYAAPELYQGEKFSTASDLWSLGCVVYELSLGCRAFDDVDPDQLVHSILTGTPNTDVPSTHTVTVQLLASLMNTQSIQRTSPSFT